MRTALTSHNKCAVVMWQEPMTLLLRGGKWPTAQYEKRGESQSSSLLHPLPFPVASPGSCLSPTPSLHLQPGLALLAQSRCSLKHHRGAPKSHHVYGCQCKEHKGLSLLSTNASLFRALSTCRPTCFVTVGLWGKETNQSGFGSVQKTH